MAGKSRRRNTPTTTPSEAAAGTESVSVASATSAAAAAKSHPDDAGVERNVLWIVMEQLDIISNSKLRCLEALQAVSDGKCSFLFDSVDSSSSSSSKIKSAAAAASEPHDGYWIVLTTHVLNRLLRHVVVMELQQQQTQTDATPTSSSTSRAAAAGATSSTTAAVVDDHLLHRRQVCWILAHLALRLTKLLLWHDKTRLEKTGNSSTTARTILGRALGSITLSCVRAMQGLSQTVTSNSNNTVPDEMDASAMLAAGTALDTVVHFQPLRPTSSDMWNRAQTSYLATATVSLTTTTNMLDRTRLQSACEKVSKTLGMNALEGPLVHLMTTPTTTASTGPSSDSASPMEIVEDETTITSDAPAATTTTKRNLRRAAATKTDYAESSSSPLIKAWEPVLKSMAANTIPMEGGARVSIRRWPSIVLISLDQGQERLLHHVVYQQLLLNFSAWAQVMECPAAESTTAAAVAAAALTTTETTKKKSPRGGNNNNNNSSNNTTTATTLKKKVDKSPIAVPGNVTVMTLLCRLLQTFSEAVHLNGHRPPTNGMDAYVACIWKSAFEATTSTTTAAPAKRARKSKSSSSSTATAADATTTLTTTTDFRHLATAIIYKLLQRHMACLGENVPKSVALVNDDDDVQLVEFSHATYYPLVHRAVDSLCRVSPFGSVGVMEQGDMSKKLLTLASCFILQMQPAPRTDEEVEQDDQGANGCVDAKLSNFAITQLGECLLHMELTEHAAVAVDDDTTKPQDVSSSTTTATAAATTAQQPKLLSGKEEGEQIQVVADKYHLYVPLFEPAIPKPPPLSATKAPSNNKRKLAAAAAASNDDAMINSTNSTYAGVLSLESDQKLTDEGVSALLVRSALKEGNIKKQVTSIAILSKLMDLVHVCYNTPPVRIHHNKVAAAASETKKRPAAGTPTSRGRKKKRKVTKKGRQEEEFDESAGGTSSDDGLVRSRINSVRAGLATEVVNCLRIILTVPAPTSSKIHVLLRKTFVQEHVEKLVKLGDMLDDVILKTRMNADAAESEEKPSSKLLFFQSSSKDFTHFERSLWSAHMNLCVTVGRGKLSFVFGENNSVAFNDKVPFLNNTDSRLSLFRSVASSSNNGSGRKSLEWPLWLPMAHHALLVSNMTSTPMPKTTRESSPESFLVHSLITSITSTLQNLSAIPSMDMSCTSEGKTRLDVEIPLSLRNARLLALAFTRLEANVRQSSLNSLISCLVTSLSDLKQDGAKDDILKTAAVSGFIGRVITTCVTLTNLIIVGESLHEPLLKLMGPAQYKLPTFSSMDKWYTAERCFMGLFSDWESPSLPIVPLSGRLTEIASDTASKLNSSLEMALSLGFERSKVDRCHLLFAAWNSMAISSLWSPQKMAFPSLSTSSPHAENSLLLMTQMRDDICFMNEFLPDNADSSEGMASKVMQRRGNREASASPLKDMIKRADTLSSILLSSFACHDDKKQQNVSPELFSLLSGLAVYVAFAVAKHTTPGTTFLANTQSSQKRGRGYLSEFPNVIDPEELAGVGSSSDSEVESELDDDVDILTKLHDACQEFGAAPCHPDWIDNTCTLRTGISSFEALEASNAALRCLSTIAAASWSQYQLCWQRAMRILVKNSSDSDCRIALALQLSMLPTNFTEPTNALASKSLKDSISLVCGIHSSVVDLLFFEYDVNHMDAIEAFCPNASQWIFGQRPHPSVLTERWSESPGELRALGEWELLMSAALIESCRDFDSGVSRLGSNISDKSIREARLNFANAEHWRVVFKRAISNLMPASALFRMAVSGVGRTSHPLNAHHVTFDDVDQGSLEFLEHVPPSASQASSEQATSVLATLGTLVCCGSKCRGDQVVLDACQAVATNLLVDSKVWLDLEAIEAFRSVATMLVGLRSVVSSSNLNRSHQLSQAVTTLITFLTSYLALPHQSSRRLPFTSQSTHLSRTIAAISPCGDFYFDTVGSKRNVSTGIPALAISIWEPSNLLPFKEKFGIVQKPTLLAMVAAVCCDTLSASGKSRSFFALILSQLAWLEGPPSKEKLFMIPCLIDAFNGIHEDTLKKVVSVDICSSDAASCDLEVVKDREAFRENLCILFTFLLAQLNGQFNHGKTVLIVLIGKLGEISSLPTPSRENVLNLLFLYAARYDSLSEVGSKIMSTVIKNSGFDESRGTLDCAVLFFGFVCDLRRRLNDQSEKSLSDHDRTMTKEHGKVESEEHGKSTKRPRLCSFAGMSGYHWQHWYNCYSCGLMGDTGCCTLCALICHRNHDVSYSRYSSFFCDCGAGNTSASEKQLLEQCNCLSPLSEAEVDDAFEGDLICVKSEEAGSAPERRDKHQGSIDYLALDIAQKVFSTAASKAVQDLLTAANEANWVQYLLKLMSRCSEPGVPIVRDEPLATGTLRSTGGDSSTSDAGVLQKSLLSRRGKPLDLQPLSQVGMLPIRAVKTSTFQFKLSVESASDQQKRAIITKSDNKRAAIAADSRGRLIVAEQRSLVFCSTAPIVNVRYEETAHDVPFGRAQMAIVGSSGLGFLIVGMELCRENERCLVVWGVTEACVVVLSVTGDSVETKFELIVDQDSENVASIVRCQFVPGSETTAVVACGPFVRVYDIGRDQANRVPPIIGFFLGYDTVLRDLAIIPVVAMQDPENEFADSKRASMYKLLLLLGNGQVHSVDLKFDREGTLETPGEQCFESSEGLSLPYEGVRMQCGSSLGPTDGVKKSFGQGSSLAYLNQSGLVLYRCESSCVLALLLDPTGKIAGSFELLPNIIKPDVLGTGPDGYGVSGPYVNWTELGTIDHGNAKAYCLACVGKSTRTSQPKLLLVVFNADFVKVKPLVWPSSGPLGLGLSLISSFEGLAAFSVPCTGEENPSSSCLRFRERACLAAATSNGSVLFFGEDFEIAPTPESATGLTIRAPSSRLTNRNRLTKSGSVRETKPRFPLTIFETLTNVDWDNVRFGGEVMGEATGTKQPLLRENNVFITSPSREGCSLTVCLWKDEKRDESQVIVALRVLVGSSNLDAIPQRVYLEGRAVELKANIKRWYDLPLTEEEVALSLRNGFVSLGISPSFDSLNNPLLDAVEIFAVERSRIDHWLPKRLSDTRVAEEENPNTVGCDDLGGQSILLPCSQALAFLCEFLGSRQSLEQADREALKRLLQATALDSSGAVRCSLMVLLEQIEPDERARVTLVDEAVLAGCAEALTQLRTAIATNVNIQGVVDIMPLNLQQKSASDLLLECLKMATAIATDRPVGYLRSIENLASDETANFSIALEVSKLLEEGKLVVGERLVAKFIELCLAEMAIAATLETRDSSLLANFDLISKLLASCKFAEWCCNAMTSFCIDICSPGVQTKDRPALFGELQAARPQIVAYKCDCCAVCPILDTRYAVLEGDHDIDLCQECYRLGVEYAEKREYAADTNVIIHGKSIGGSPTLNCAQIRQMQPVPITRADVENLESAHLLQGASTAPALATLPDTTNQVEGGTEGVETTLGQAVFDDFCNEIFGKTLDLVHACLTRPPPFNLQLEPILKFLLDLIRHSSGKKEKLSRSKQFARKIPLCLSRLLQAGVKHDKADRESGQKTLIICLRALAALVATETDASCCVTDSREIADGDAGLTVDKPSRIVCEVHGFPGVRRRCAHGVDKDRRFYVCGKEKGARCDFFVWADEVDKSTNSDVKPKPRSDPIVQSFLWEMLLSTSNVDNTPMHVQICTVLEQDLATTGGRPFGAQSHENVSSTIDQSNSKGYNYPEDLLTEYHDGVFCSREKLQGSRALVKLERVLPTEMTIRGSFNKRALSHEPRESMLDASLDLLASLPGINSGSPHDEGSSVSRWYPLLCEIISSTEENQLLRSKAKKVLKAFCGGSRVVYHAIRDHFVFGFQFRNFIRNAKVALETSLALVEQARQCSLQWKTSEKIEWAGLSAGGLLGCQDLVPEDALSVQCERDIAKILDEIWNVIKSRGGNWRRFCGLFSLPRSHREGNLASYLESRTQPSFNAIFSVSPIMSLFWAACSLRGSNQLKAMMLVDAALVNWAERKSLSFKGKVKSVGNSTANELLSSDDEINQDVSDEKGFEGSDSTEYTSPESLLLRGPSKFSIAELHAFVMQFVCTGRTTQVRKVACHITCKLFQALEEDERVTFFVGLAGEALDDVGAFGKSSVDFLMLLQTTLRLLTPSFLPISDIADRTAARSLHQLRQLKFCGDWMIFDVGSGSAASRKRIDLSLCINCHRAAASVASKEPQLQEGDNAATSRDASTRTTRTPGPSGGARSQGKAKWLPEQVQPFVRRRLDGSKDDSVSNEFATFVQLKLRLAISEVHVSVSEPRGRYVKTITVFFTPRPVTDVDILKTDDYARKWQRCATLSLTRGANKASCTVPIPVVAANLKFEYTEFYERAGGSKASDGSLLVHCPRCTRVVQNAHGVCGNCGEVAFQCRKCRHINYDRLDAFLCVECGYCAAGNFSFEVTGGVASNAVAITNDEDYERAVSLLAVATRLSGEIRTALTEHIEGACRPKKSKIRSDGDQLSGLAPDVKRAFRGEFPLSANWRGDEGETDRRFSRLSTAERLVPNGSVVASIACSDMASGSRRSSSGSNVVDRTRNLLRIARQIRSDNSAGRRSTSDVILRHFGRGSLSIDSLDEDGDFIDLLEGAGSSDPLGRLVASIQSRSARDRERSEAEARGGAERQAATTGASGAGSGSSKTDPAASASSSSKDALNECEKLYQLNREAERECAELNRRIAAWKRLDSGNLVSLSATTAVHGPCHCTSCCGAMALHLLQLWHRLFLAAPDYVHVSKSMLTALLDESIALPKSLVDLKRAIVRDLATKSPKGSKLVLDELRTRLAANCDVASSEILGQILETVEDVENCDFLDLAIKVLEE